jgi:hypothetical protein
LCKGTRGESTCVIVGFESVYLRCKAFLTIHVLLLSQDCMPEDLNIPENRPEYGMDHVDVMAYLGLKRAIPLSKKEDDDDAVAP